MTFRDLAMSSARYHWRSYAGMIAGVAVTCAIITGALLVGDSVRYSLRQLAGQRLQQVTTSLYTHDRFFGDNLAPELAGELKLPFAAVIQTPGIILLPDESRQANQVQVLGVDDPFWELGATAPPALPAINRRLADYLGVGVGDAIVVRVTQPGLLPRDATLSPSDATTVSWRISIKAIVDAETFGNFNLELSQIPPLNLFLPRHELAAELEQEGRANLLLGGVGSDVDALTEALRRRLKLDDAGFSLLPVPDRPFVELRSRHAFIPANIASRAAASSPDSQQLLTYFVNSLVHGNRRTPYSMVTSSSAWEQLGDDGIAINSWSAVDLQADVGDTVEISYYVLDAGSRLITQSASFTVREIIEMDDPRLDPAMMPDFPGLSDADNCRDWESGVPIDLSLIRPKDEAYWDAWRGTPKALISLTAGQRLWANRFGTVTAVRLPPHDALGDTLREELLQQPGELGFSPVPIAELSEQAWRNSLDFGQYFVAFSAFLIVAALLLTGLLFSFNLKRRLPEIGMLLAAGYSRRRVRWLYTLEAALLALPGILLGIVPGMLYTGGILWGLTHVWQGAVGDWPIGFHASAPNVVSGALATLIVAVGTIWLTGRPISKAPIHRLLTGSLNDPLEQQRRVPLFSFLGFVCLLAGIATIWIGIIVSSANDTLIFFLGAILLLIGGLSVFSDLLARLARGSRPEAPGLVHLAGRNLGRRRGRSVAVAAILAAGVFLVVALESQRLQRPADPRQSPGTGGFTLYGETTLPIYADLNTYGAREDLGLNNASLPPFVVLPVRLRQGDDASCLNLNRAQQPRIAALDSRAMQQRRAFTFSRLATAAEEPWALLRPADEAGALPAFTDYNSLTYTMGYRVGDTITGYTGDAGEALGVQVMAALDANLLRGMLIVDEAAFLRHWPTASGYRIFLIDCHPRDAEVITQALNRALADYGMQVRPATEVLAEFDRVQNTYITIFQVLGGLGLLLGSIGLGLLVFNHVLERRAEFALLRAVGFAHGFIRRMLFVEHAILYLAGMMIGAIAAAGAVLPLLLRPGSEIPWISLVIVVAILSCCGILSIALAARIAWRGEMISALRRE